jgi:hypothetical protein
MVRKLHEDFGEPKMKNGGCRRNGHKDVDKDMSHVQVPPSNTREKKIYIGDLQRKHTLPIAMMRQSERRE